jgi:hypothetical protein
LAALSSACGSPTPGPSEEARDPITHLTPSESQQVLAKVGERTITLGEYAMTLARMAPFERLRYQTAERQKQLLDEMVQVELLAQEARRRGLDKTPEVELRIAQALRDEVLEELRAKLPAADSLTEREVRDYYSAHQDEFREPERRRALLLVVAQKANAEALARRTAEVSGAEWGALVAKNSLDRRGTGPKDAPEWAGDFGFVSAPGESRGANPEIPEPVRASLFKLQKLGEVAAEPVEAGGRFYVVRLGGTSAARDRSLREADRTIRVELLRQRYLQSERALEAELRQKFPVVIDSKALAAVPSSAPAPRTADPAPSTP